MSEFASAKSGIGGSWVWVGNNPISGPHEHGKAEHIAEAINAAHAESVRPLVDELKRLREVVAPVDVESIDMILESHR